MKKTAKKSEKKPEPVEEPKLPTPELRLDPTTEWPEVVGRGKNNELLASNGGEICPFCHQVRECVSIRPWRPKGCVPTVAAHYRACEECFQKPRRPILVQDGGEPIPPAEEDGPPEGVVIAEGSENPAPEGLDIASKLKQSLSGAKPQEPEKEEQP